MDRFSVLRGVEVFSDFGDEALRRLAEASWEGDYSAGQVVLRAGQVVESVGVVVSGSVELRHGTDPDGPAPVELGAGQLFGVIALLTGEASLAEGVATTSARVLHISHRELSLELSRTPMAAQRLARLLTARLLQRGGNPDEQQAVEQARAQALSLNAKATGEAPLLVLSCSTNSLRYQLFRGNEAGIRGEVERIGQGRSRLRHYHEAEVFERDDIVPDHEAALRWMLDLLVDPVRGGLLRLEDLAAVGHRVVHGGVRFTESTVVTPEVLDELQRISGLAPLHNPINLEGIRACQRLLPPGVAQVCVFDTAFHNTLPEHVYRYALPRELADRHHLRRFGFHGSSHKYVSRAACAFLGEPADSGKIISCHLGIGSSVAAIEHGRSVDTSMGLTPLEGLPMSTRSGDVDPGLVLHLLDLGMSRDEVDRLLNKESGMLGLSGFSSDMRELEKAADSGHEGALLAIQTFCYRVRKYLGAYTAAMGGLDTLVFTGGIGEHRAGIRARICQGLSCLGITLDEERNARPLEPGEQARVISTEGSRVRVLVVPTDEAAVIASETARALKRFGITELLQSRRERPIPIGISAHHVHLCQEHVELLFGPGHQLTPFKELSQPGQFACEEKVELVGPKGRISRVRVLGPTRPHTQVEISRTEEYVLGIDAPVRASGDVKGSPGLTLVGTAGQVSLPHGVICALRHIHMPPDDALVYGLRDKDVVRVLVQGEGRSLIYGDVLVRVTGQSGLELHIDTDEANAGQVRPGMVAFVDSIQRLGA